jgi:hypothetical protein
MLGLFLAILKELMPFLKEALLEGQTFKGWLKNNWLTFAWLINTLALVLMIAHLADLVAQARYRENLALQQVSLIQQPLGQLVVKHKQLMAENAQLKTTVTELTDTQQQYEQWMTTCGVQYQDRGQCKVPVVSTQPHTTKKRKRPAPKPQPAVPQVNRGFLGKLRALLQRDKDEE